MDNEAPASDKSPAQTGRHAEHPTSRGPVPNAKRNKKQTKYIILAVTLGLLLAIIAFGGWSLYRSSTTAHIDGNKLQAVFFTNGQVYFGKLEKLNGDYFKLTDIFYLQAQSAAADSENPQETSTQQSPDVQLVKLGSEIHGPDDEMIINKDQLLFFENLKKDGKVTDSINKYKSEND